MSATPRLIAFVLLVLTTTTGCRSPEARLHDDVADLAERSGMHGWIRVQSDGRLVMDRALGPVSESIPRPDAETPVHIASLSKLLTQVAALRLIDQGRLDEDATIRTYRRGFRSALGDSITIRRLIDMSSGLPRELDAEHLFQTRLLDEHGFAGPHLDTMIASPRSPSNEGAYSNLDYWLLGAVVESATGAPLGDALDLLVLDPLGLRETGYRDRAVEPMPGYDLVDGGFTEVREDLTLRYASGGYVSSTRDLQTLGSALLDPGFLTEASLVRLFDQGGSPERLEIFGALPGHSHMLVIDRSARLVVTALNNVALRDLDGMIQLRDRVLSFTGMATPEATGTRRTVVVRPTADLSDMDPIESCLATWIPMLRDGTAADIHAGIARCGPEGAFESGDPTWAEYVRIRTYADSFAIAGWRRVDDGEPAGVEVWIDFHEAGKLALLLIPAEGDSTRVGNLMVKPDDLTWLGRGY